MKKIIILSVLIAGLIGDGFAVTRSAGRATARSGGATSSSAATKTTAARSARGARTAPAPGVAVRGRAATTTATKPVVAARAGATQKVIGTGTKVAVAAKNVVVSDECREKYEGCMDSFCMLDNETGGRCLCSDKNKELDAILAEIEKLDQQSYQMATFGVERIEMGDDAEAAIANANAAAQSVIDNGQEEQVGVGRKKLDLSAWDINYDDMGEDIEVFGIGGMSPIDDKEGDELHSYVMNLCSNQIPECSTEINLLQMMYAQRIKSDCAAYENSLKQQKNSSAQKLATAERALREAALEQYRNANKYDLGQCTVEFKKCIQTTGGCGEDFSGCASMVAMDSTNLRKSTSKTKAKGYQIKGAVTNIEISASTYDTLLGKKPLCEYVTKSCVNVADQVWDTFLREAAPQVKSAELIAEDKARQDCIGNISSCFQKACKDNMDPNDPDGSYDMCLSRPGTMLNLCQVPLNACGIDATSEATADQSPIWEFVVARLASIRVDSCTTEVKECLQSEDRCGKDYTQCIGLDTDTIMRMCPYEKLVGCQKVYGTDDITGDAVYDQLASMVQGVMLNIDNSFMEECQNALNEAMIKVCGDTESCDELTTDENIGARTLEYKLCEWNESERKFSTNCKANVSQITDQELGRGATVQIGSSDGKASSSDSSPVIRKAFAGKLEGQIPWDLVSFLDDGSDAEDGAAVQSAGSIKIKEVFLKAKDLQDEPKKDEVMSELNVLKNNINSAIAAIEADPKVQFCMTGREVQGMRIKDRDDENLTRTSFGDKNNARFPHLTSQVKAIIANSAIKIAKDNYYRKQDELNKKMAQDYAAIGERIAEIDQLNALDVRREHGRAACVNLAKGAVMPTSRWKTTIPTQPSPEMLVGSAVRNDYNYKQTITATYAWDTLVCHKCVRVQNCAKAKRKFCKSWGEETETCEDIQF